MNFKKLESGRSMVEMLGVLAIIGVLSVGGIAGYSLSMRRHRANAVVDAVSKYASLNYGKCQQKIISGEITGGGSTVFISGIVLGCESSSFPDFTNTDLGQLPAGVKDIFNKGVEIYPEGNDTVSTYVSMSDQKLCQAVASIVGGTCEEWPGLDAYGVIVKINQN